MGGLWATKSEGVGLIVRAVSFQKCDPDPPTSQTDGQADGRQAIAIGLPRFALYSASRVENHFNSNADCRMY